MGILNRYIVRQIIVPSLLAVTVVAVLGVANEIQEEERGGLLPVAQMTLGDVSRLALYTLPALVGYLVPITYMLGIMMAFGRMAHDNEIVAMKAAGIPLKRAVLPVIAIGLLLSGVSFTIEDRVRPWAIAKASEFIHGELPLRASLDVLPTGMIQEYAGWRVYIGRRDPKTGVLEDVIILKPEENGAASTFYAASARIASEHGKSMLEMSQVHFIPPGESGEVMPLKTDVMRLPVPTIPIRVAEPSRKTMTLAGLLAEHQNLTREVQETPSEPAKLELRKQRRDIAERLSLPFACLAVSLAAAPLGARARRAGKSYTFAVGFTILLVYYVFGMLMEPKSLYPLWVTVLRVWLPNLAFCVAGLYFLWRVDRV